MQNNNLVSSFNIFGNKSFRKTIGASLFLASFASGTTQGAETSKIQENLFAERNNKPYVLEDIKAQIEPILDEKIEKDFMPFIEAMFDSKFPAPVHSPLSVFKNWNNFLKDLIAAKDAPSTNGNHPQILVLRADIICHHYFVFEDKFPHLTELEAWLG